MRIKDNISLGCLLLICIGLFIFSLQLNQIFFRVYHLPFGMSDVDAYACWLGQHIDYRDDCTSVPLSHLLVVEIIEHIGGIASMVWFIPFLLCFVIPILLYLLYDSMGLTESECFFSVLVFIFMSFSFLSFTFISVYAQMISFCFTILSLIFYRRSKLILFIIFMVLSIASHYMSLLFYFLLILGELIRRKYYRILVIIFFVFVYFFFSYNINYYTTLYKRAGSQQPGLYEMLFWFTFPLTFAFMFFGYLDERFKWLFLFLLLICPFIELGRGMYYFHIFMSPMVYLGYKRLCGFLDSRSKILFTLFLCGFCVIWFLQLLSLFIHSMVKEFVFRGLDASLLKTLGL
jgi:hypothetical protein